MTATKFIHCKGVQQLEQLLASPAFAELMDGDRIGASMNELKRRFKQLPEVMVIRMVALAKEAFALTGRKCFWIVQIPKEDTLPRLLGAQLWDCYASLSLKLLQSFALCNPETEVAVALHIQDGNLPITTGTVIRLHRPSPLPDEFKATPLNLMLNKQIWQVNIECCFICEMPFAPKSCQRCWQAFYCSEQCKMVDSKKHGQYCHWLARCRN
jgi:hypothetical protein